MCAAFRGDTCRRRLLLRDDGLELELAKLHVGAQSEERAGSGDERRVGGERHVATLHELDDLVFLALVLELHALGIEVEGGVGVVVEVHVHLVAHLAVHVEVDLLVEVHRGGLAVADGQRGVVDVLERGAELELGGSLRLDAHAARTEDLLGRSQVEVHVGEVELLLALRLYHLLVLAAPEVAHELALAPLEVLAEVHHDGGAHIGAANLVADDVAVDGVVVLHRLLHVLGPLQVGGALVEVVLGDGDGALYLPPGVEQ